ncbi:MAG: Nif3-like dinuclear metal center hexameric protein [Burkholderia sp.]|nr:Nif3-like dinuclear metal center hexameric protein [Burkholderia sp.]
MDRIELELYLNKILEIERFKDYCPNGLQVEGRREIKKIATGVTASIALLDEALKWGADAVLVHHGYFWRNEVPTITGRKYQRLKRLLENKLNLFAFHLPLDAHPIFGNNSQLGKKLDLVGELHFGNDNLGWMAVLSSPVTLKYFVEKVENILDRTPLVFGNIDMQLHRIAWCTGAAQDYFDAAIDAGADVFLTGEVSESVTHIASESCVAFISAGHHATERYGIQALGTYLSEHFDLNHIFIDIPNSI